MDAGGNEDVIVARDLVVGFVLIADRNALALLVRMAIARMLSDVLSGGNLRLISRNP